MEKSRKSQVGPQGCRGRASSRATWGSWRWLLVGLLAVCLGLAPAPGAAANEVVIYTAHAAEIVNEIIPLFEQETGISASVVIAGSSHIIQRVRAEANRPLGDVIWSIGPEPLEAHSQLLEHYQSVHWDALDPLYRVGTNWLPYTGVPMVIMVNTDLVPEEEWPRKWADLADPKWKGRVAFAGADVSGSAFMQLATILHIYGEQEGWRLFERMMDNFIITESSGRVFRGTADGEYAVGLTLEEAANRFYVGGAPVALIYPEEGTSALPDGVALIKNGPNPENGKRFIDFVLSKPIQELLVERMQRRSVRTDVAAPTGLVPLSELNIANYDLNWAADNRDMIIRRYQSLLRR